jgi:3-deoxy-manno-octulosonate cytidylyltransferase (CMP-KDO synthetase)
MIHLVIPLRTASQRVPEKIFAKVQGRELLLRMAEHAAFFQEEIVGLQSHLAVDSKKAVDALVNYRQKISVHLTDPALPSGTDRVCDVLKKLPMETIDRNEWIVNVQGDMPFLCRKSMALFVHQLKNIPAEFSMATICEAFQSIEDYKSPGVVKVLVGPDHRSVYFSRLPIPYGREAIPLNAADLIAQSHVGVYAYRAKTLLKLASLAPHKIEIAEGLEQLRALAAGIQIYAVKSQPTPGTSFRGIDLPSDLEWANAFKG